MDQNQDTGPEKWNPGPRTETQIPYPVLFTNIYFPKGKGLECLEKPENQHSENVVSVYWERINKNSKIIGHNPGALATVVHGMIL